MEQNQSEYSDLKQNLKQMFNICKDLSEKQKLFKGNIVKTQLHASKSISKDSSKVDLVSLIKQGDILSNLMDFERKSVFSTAKAYNLVRMTVATQKYMDNHRGSSEDENLKV